MSTLTCRFYKNRLPDVDEVVMVVIRNIADIGAYVGLLEYNNIEGMILMSELSRRRIRSINKLIRVGKTESVVVIRVDKDKCYIDLSKRRVSPEEIKECEEKYIRAKTVYHIVLHTAEVLGIKTNEELESFMAQTAWFFDEKYKNCGGAYETFRRLILEPHLLDDCILTDSQKKALIHTIRHRLEPKKAKVRADVEVACYCPEGIEAIRASLLAGLSLSTAPDIPVKINLIAPPIYMISSVVFDRDAGLKAITDVVDVIKKEITARGGQFNLKLAPKVVTDIDEAELTKRISELVRVNEDVDGDDDVSVSEDEDALLKEDIYCGPTLPSL